jgi:hypothetical protein
MDRAKVRQVLMSAFPRMNENSEAGKRQREDAGRWAAVINLYFRLKYTSTQVADELYPSHLKVDQRDNGRRYVAGACKIRGMIQAIQRKVKAIERGSARQRGRPARNPVFVEVL